MALDRVGPHDRQRSPLRPPDLLPQGQRKRAASCKRPPADTVALDQETRGAKILAGRAKQLRAETGNQHIKSSSELESESIKDLLKKSSTRAVSLMVHEPVLFMFGFWIAMAWGITFLFLSVIVSVPQFYPPRTAADPAGAHSPSRSKATTAGLKATVVSPTSPLSSGAFSASELVLSQTPSTTKSGRPTGVCPFPSEFTLYNIVLCRRS